jgi:hypothetical protein
MATGWYETLAKEAKPPLLVTDTILMTLTDVPSGARVLIGDPPDGPTLGYVSTVYVNKGGWEECGGAFIVPRKPLYCIRIRHLGYTSVELNFSLHPSLPPFGHVSIDVGALMQPDGIVGVA